MMVCPMNDFTCPYCNKKGMCFMKEIGDGDPVEGCDAFYGVDPNAFDPYMDC